MWSDFLLGVGWGLLLYSVACLMQRKYRDRL